MIRFEHTLTVARPVDAVFAFLADPVSLASWNWFVEDVRAITRGPPRVGSRYVATRKSDALTLEVIERVDDERVAFRVQGDGVALVMRLTVTPTRDGGTRITDAWALDARVPRLLEPVAAARVRGAVRENLARLRRLLDDGQVVLQDGRRSALAGGPVT